MNLVLRTESIGCHLVDFRDDSLGFFARRLCIVARHTKAAIAFIVGIGDRNDGHIDRESLAKHGGDVLEIAWDEVGLLIEEGLA